MSETENGIRTNERGELVLSIDALRPKPRWLELPDGNGGVQSVKLPGNLPLQKMLDLQAIEQELSRKDGNDATAIAALREFSEMLTELISEANPDLPADFTVELGIVEATHLLIFIAQPDDSIAQAFVKAITAGGGEKPDAASDDAHTLAQKAGLEDADSEEAARPLRSEKRSSVSSSRSARSTAGRRSGGSSRASRGKRSASTSATRSTGKKSASATD